MELNKNKTKKKQRTDQQNANLVWLDEEKNKKGKIKSSALQAATDNNNVMYHWWYVWQEPRATMVGTMDGWEMHDDGDGVLTVVGISHLFLILF